VTEDITLENLKGPSNTEIAEEVPLQNHMQKLEELVTDDIKNEEYEGTFQ
jgi:hypothetical protein